MLLIEAMKGKKHLVRKMEDLRKKIQLHCADLDCMQPTYGSAEEQTKKISEWLQMHHDLALELTTLNKNIQKTNLATNVTIKIDDKPITRSILEWVIRRQGIIDLEVSAYNVLSDRGYSDKSILSYGSVDREKVKNARVRFYFNAADRDKQLEILKSEKESIDNSLEVVNATTTLIEN